MKVSKSNKNRLFRLLICALGLLIAISMNGQEAGIKFETGLTWKQIQAKARTENKYIFMDCYATWCGPCKWMDKNIFSDKEVGDYFNSHFINVAVQMDKTASDDLAIKDWYVDAANFSKNYAIGIYPTYLFFGPDGKIVHRFVGATKEKLEFISKGKDALDPEKQYYTLLDRCKAHKKDSAYLLQAWQFTASIEDVERTTIIGNWYLDCLKDPLTKDNIQSCRIILLTAGLDDCKKGFQFFFKNTKRINSIMGDSLYAENALASVLNTKYLTPLFEKKLPIVSWSKFTKDIQAKYPGLSTSVFEIEKKTFGAYVQREIQLDVYKIKTTTQEDWDKKAQQFRKKFPDYDFGIYFTEAKYLLYKRKKMWDDSSKAAYSFLQKYGDKLSDNGMNNVIWDPIFLHCNDTVILNDAIGRMKTVVMRSPNNGGYADTYANLLYKIGKKEDAIIWDTKAIAIINENIEKQPSLKAYLQKDVKEFQASLEKMQKDLPTWSTD